MFDFNLVGTHFLEPKMVTGRFVGAGAANIAPVASVTDSQSTKTSVNRLSAGNLVITFLDVPLGVPQSYDFWICSPLANVKNTLVTPYVANTSPYAFTVNIAYQSNNVAVDLASTEELHFQVWFKRGNSGGT